MLSTKVLVDNMPCSNNETKNMICDLDKSRSFPWFLYFCGFTANLLLTTMGFSLVWMSGALPKLQSNDTAINPLGVPITTTQISILASIGPIVSLIGLQMMGILSDKIGRRKTMMAVATITASTNFVMAFSKHIYIYYICILISGFAISGALVCVPVYNTEIAEDNNRGKLGCLMGLAIPIGILLGYIFGPLTTVQGISLICAVPSMLHLLLSTMTHDSPTYLASKGYKIEALKALEMFRRCDNAKYIETEYQKIQECSSNSVLLKKRSILDIFRNAAPRKAFLISMEIFATQQFSGIFVMLSFMAPIFNEAHSNLSGDAVGVLVGLVQISMFLIAACIVEKIGRRSLLLFSSMCCAGSLFLLGLYFYLKRKEVDIVEEISWLPILCVIVFFVSYGSGLGPIPIALMGELFPNELRATGVATVLFIDNFVSFLIMFSFPHISTAIGIYYCFWIFSVACCTGCIGMFFTLPETKGKSFSEIQRILAK